MDSSFQSEVNIAKQRMGPSFNPCFNGFFFSIFALRADGWYLRVSILVLMDSSFQSSLAHGADQSPGVSILVLMDSSFGNLKLTH